MKKITYAIYDGDYQKGGVYNVLASFSRGLLKGFKEAGLNAFVYDECIKNNIDYDVVLGVNLAGFPYWQQNLNSNKFNLLWNIDTIFGHNFEVFKSCQQFENFILLNVSQTDFNAAAYYLPKLKISPLFHATDKDLWKEEKSEKEFDIVFLSSLYDFETSLKQYENNKLAYGLIVEMVDIMMKQPALNFWEVYQYIKEACKITIDVDEYAELNKVVTMIVEQKQKIKMIESLSNFNVKVFGNDLWKKYIKGKVEYKGSVDVIDSVKIINASKISLHCQTSVLNHGLHERILNAASVGTFNLTSSTPFIEKEFGESFGYFDMSTFEDVADKAQYYLNNIAQREQKAKEAQKIVHQKHLWKNRADEINLLFTY